MQWKFKIKFNLIKNNGHVQLTLTIYWISLPDYILLLVILEIIVSNSKPWKFDIPFHLAKIRINKVSIYKCWNKRQIIHYSKIHELIIFLYWFFRKKMENYPLFIGEIHLFSCFGAIWWEVIFNAVIILTSNPLTVFCFSYWKLREKRFKIMLKILNPLLLHEVSQILTIQES